MKPATEQPAIKQTTNQPRNQLAVNQLISNQVAGLAQLKEAARPRRIAFAGTPIDAVPALTALVEAGFEVPLVVTAEDARRSRRGKPTPTPVGQAAQALGLTVSHDIADVVAAVAADGDGGSSAADDAVAADGGSAADDDGAGSAGAGSAGASDVMPDCVVVVAFGQLISTELLAQVPMLNLHFSLLPRWRGAAPVERALLAGDNHVGVCLMAIEPTLDTGPVYWREQIEVGDQSAAELRTELADIGARRLVRSLKSGLEKPTPQEKLWAELQELRIEQDESRAEPQETSPAQPTYAKKLTREDRQLRWELPAIQLERVVRVGQAWTTVDGNVFKIHKARVLSAADTSTAASMSTAAGTTQISPGAAVTPSTSATPSTSDTPGLLRGDVVHCGEGALVLEVVQPAGRASMTAADWLRGARLPDDTILGN